MRILFVQRQGATAAHRYRRTDRFSRYWALRFVPASLGKAFWFVHGLMTHAVRTGLPPFRLCAGTLHDGGQLRASRIGVVVGNPAPG